jgi:hypothetical protein
MIRLVYKDCRRSFVVSFNLGLEFGLFFPNCLFFAGSWLIKTGRFASLNRYIPIAGYLNRHNISSHNAAL